MLLRKPVSMWRPQRSKYIVAPIERVHLLLRLLPERGPILYINTLKGELEESRAGLQSIPGNPSTVAFSPDGLLVYAVEGSEILTYVFNPHSGLLTARTIINAPGVLSILPWV